jgi:uncharacterized membrane protein YgcG
LANNSKQVQRFIVEANNLATDTATQDNNLRLTWQKLPGFLEQLRPAMAKLSAAATANTPVLINLNAGASQLNRFLRDLPPFSRSAIPAIKALGKASVTGRQAVIAAGPTIADLNQFAKPTPELAQNLAIVGHDLDDRSRAVEPDPRSPGGKGFTGLEALLQYVFNQALAINTFGPFGHQLAVDGFISQCSGYASPKSIAMNLAGPNGSSYRKCYSWLGPEQPGVNVRDPSNPNGCVPDPGGAPPGHRGPQTSACKMSATPSPPTGPGGLPLPLSADSSKSSSGGSSNSRSAGGGSSGGVGKAVGGVANTVSGRTGGTTSSTTPSTGSTSSRANQASQLLNYLLAP